MNPTLNCDLLGILYELKKQEIWYDEELANPFKVSKDYYEMMQTCLLNTRTEILRISKLLDEKIGLII